MSDITTTRRQLKIKSGVLKRVWKEHISYEKEAEDQQRKLDKFVAEGVEAEEWDIKNATRMMEESNKMIADSKNRLGKAVGELRDLVVSAKKEPELAEDEDLRKAEEVLEEAGI